MLMKVEENNNKGLVRSHSQCTIMMCEWGHDFIQAHYQPTMTHFKTNACC